MQIVMMGTGPFAVPTFKWLLQSGHSVPALVTRPPRGRRGEPPNPMRKVAEEHDLPVFMPEGINTPLAHDMLVPLAAELFVVCDYGQILSADTLALASHGGINLHGSLLPKYRGAAPVNWAIYEGEPETGVTVIHMTPKLDGGPCVAVRRTPINPHEDAPQLEARLSLLGVDAVREAIDRLASSKPGDVVGENQDAAQATKAPRLKKSDGAVDWNRSAGQIRNQVRAMKPWPGTYTYWLAPAGAPARLILEDVAVIDAANAGHCPGIVVDVENDRLHVATGSGLLSLETIKPAGRRAMSIAEWLRGHSVNVGDRFDDFEAAENL